MSGTEASDNPSIIFILDENKVECMATKEAAGDLVVLEIFKFVAAENTLLLPIEERKVPGPFVPLAINIKVDTRFEFTLLPTVVESWVNVAVKDLLDGS